MTTLARQAILLSNAQAMTKLITIFTVILFSQLVSAQSLSPVSMTSAASVTVKASKRLSASTGELTLRATSLSTAKSTVVAETATMDVYPNPAAGLVSFSFQMAGAGKMSVSLTNAIGEKISELFAGNYDNGKVSEQMDISQYTAGMYFINLQYIDADGKAHSISKKLQVL